MLRKAGGAWTLAGVVDIEDHQFTDRRFVLAGLELSHTWHGRTVPPAFWDAYGHAPPDHERFKPLFQLYYLLVWARVLQGQPAAFARCLEMLEGLAA